MFDIELYLETRKTEVETELFKSLPAIGSCPAILGEAMVHAVKSGGKRLRPILCLAAAEAAAGRHSGAMFPACAVELLHSYTLVHDDLPCMDNDLLRRGLPTVHAKYGEAIAVLAGDALLTLAFETLARTPVAGSTTMSQLVVELCRASGAAGVIGGQVADIEFAGNPTPEAVRYVFEHKTGALFRVAARLGAMAANASPESLHLLTVYAEHLGFAFQIIDDILDANQAKSDGQPELSCLTIMSLADARAWAADHTRRATEALQNLPGDTAALRALVEMLLTRIA
ncbi:MAG: polyprenyl synthetase family protein [Kiritimatiellae bacterium]|nr:polyprenyl synthetase family protein [Kiritimatiellia bacterium]